MRVIDKELEAAHVVEERREAFKDFVKAKKDKGEAVTGKVNMALYNMGFRDSYGPVEYSLGFHDNKWILPDEKNGKVLVFTKSKDAQSYADSLLGILKDQGFKKSRVWVEEVAIRKSSGFALIPALAARLTFEDTDRYIIRIEVK